MCILGAAWLTRPLPLADCLNDLLFRVSSGTLPITVPLIVSNHNDYAQLAAAHNIPFFHLPINAKEGKTKEWQEGEIVRLAEGASSASFPSPAGRSIADTLMSGQSTRSTLWCLPDTCRS